MVAYLIFYQNITRSNSVEVSLETIVNNSLDQSCVTSDFFCSKTILNQTCLFLFVVSVCVFAAVSGLAFVKNKWR